jgi:hypothetical protein
VKSDLSNCMVELIEMLLLDTQTNYHLVKLQGSMMIEKPRTEEMTCKCWMGSVYFVERNN